MLLIGDLNKHVGADEEGIEGNNVRISYGGELLRKFLAEKNFSMLNRYALTKGVLLLEWTLPTQAKSHALIMLLFLLSYYLSLMK